MSIKNSFFIFLKLMRLSALQAPLSVRHVPAPDVAVLLNGEVAVVDGNAYVIPGSVVSSMKFSDISQKLKGKLASRFFKYHLNFADDVMTACISSLDADRTLDFGKQNLIVLSTLLTHLSSHM